MRTEGWVVGLVGMQRGRERDRTESAWAPLETTPSAKTQAEAVCDNPKLKERTEVLTH